MKKTVSTFLLFLLTSSVLTILLLNVNAQGAAEQLTTNPYKDRYPSWSPDGSKIIYSAFSGSWNRHLWAMSSDGSGKEQLTFGNVVDECPVYSPDGSKILFTRWGARGDYLDLMLMDSDLSSPPERLTLAGIPGLGVGTYNFPQWSQDGSKIVFAYGEGTTGLPWENKKFWVCTMNPDGTGIDVLGRGVFPKFVLEDSKILFNTDRFGSADLRIAMMNSDGTGFEYLTAGPADHSPDLSPLTQRIVFTRAPVFGQNGDLCIRRLSSASVTPLIEDGQNQQAFWSPDEKSIVYVSEATGNLDIWKIGAPPEEVPAIVDINPNTLNLWSNGKWITAYVELPEGYNVSDIDVSTLLLNGTVSMETFPTCIGDHDGDGVPDLMVKFSRNDVQNYIVAMTGVPTDPIWVTLTITGSLDDATDLVGSALIRVMARGGGGPGRAALHC